MFVVSCGLDVVLVVVLGLLFASLIVTLVMWFVGVAFRVFVVPCFGDLDCVVYRCLLCGFGLLFASLLDSWVLFVDYCVC